jgi:hypothetical protein
VPRLSSMYCRLSAMQTMFPCLSSTLRHWPTWHHSQASLVENITWQRTRTNEQSMAVFLRAR